MVPAAVFQANDLLGITLHQSTHELHAEADLGHGWNVVEVDAELWTGDLLDYLAEVAEKALVADGLVEERREHKDATALSLDGLMGHLHGLAEGARAGPHHEFFGGDAMLDLGIE